MELSWRWQFGFERDASVSEQPSVDLELLRAPLGQTLLDAVAELNADAIPAPGSGATSRHL